MKYHLLAIVCLSLFTLTACPEQIDEPPFPTDMTVDVGVDLPDMTDLPDQSTSAQCMVVRVEPATLPIDDTPHRVDVRISCDGNTSLQVPDALQRQTGEGGQVESSDCTFDGDAQTNCTARVTGLRAVDAPGPETLTFETNASPLSATIRWHLTPQALTDRVANIKVRAAKQAMGINSLGAGIQVIDGDPTVIGWASKDKCCEELVFEKGLSFGMDVSKYKLDEDKPPQPPGNIVDQQTSLASSPDGFDSMFWGQSEDTTNNTTAFVGVRYALDKKGQRVDTVSLKVAAADIQRVIGSGVYLPKELGVDSTQKSGEVVALHSTSKDQWALTRLFTGLARDEASTFKTFDTLAGLSPKQFEQAQAWMGLLTRPVQARVEDGQFVLAAWSAQKTRDGITLSAVPLGKGATGDASSSITMTTGFEVSHVHVGFALPGRLVVLLVGAQGQERLFALNTPNGLENLKSLEMPEVLNATGSFRPSGRVPNHSIFYQQKRTSALPVLTNATGNLLLLHQGTNSLVRWRWDEEAQGTLLSVVPQRVDDATRMGEAGQVVSLAAVSSSAFAVVTLDPTEETCGPDCFAPLTQHQNGLEVGLIGGEQPRLGARLANETRPLEVPTSPEAARWFKPRVAQLGDRSMIFIPIQTKDAMHADAMIFWIVDAQGQPSQPATVQVSKTADHRTLTVSNMQTEVIVFFKPDATQGAYGTTSVEALQANLGKPGVQTLPLTSTSVVAGSSDASPLLFGPTVSMDVRGGLWSSTTFETSALSARPIHALRLNDDPCPTILLDQFSAPKTKPVTTSVDLIQAGQGDGCEGQRRWVARGDFLGAGGQQVMLFDGRSFSLLFTTQDGTQLVRLDDVYRFESTEIIHVAAEDFNLDGLTDLAVDHGHPDGVMILFSDGLGQMLPSSGRIPAVSLVVDVDVAGVDPRFASFGSGTKKSTTTTQSSHPQLQ